jgi:hypothetical protein
VPSLSRIFGEAEAVGPTLGAAASGAPFFFGLPTPKTKHARARERGKASIGVIDEFCRADRVQHGQISGNAIGKLIYLIDTLTVLVAI